MELVAGQRPFISLPLASHFEQRLHVRHRLDRYGAKTWLNYEDADPQTLAGAVAGALEGEPSYLRSVRAAPRGRPASSPGSSSRSSS